MEVGRGVGSTILDIEIGHKRLAGRVIDTKAAPVAKADVRIVPADGGRYQLSTADVE